MEEKLKNILCTFVNAVIIAGIIILFIGLYYFIIKAGIPYQDPPLELRIQYEVNAGIGDVLIGSGFKIAVLSGIIRIILGLVCKK